MKYLWLLVLLVCSTARAEELHLLSLDQFDFDSYRIINHQDPYFPYKDMGSDGEHWDKGAAINFDIDLVKYAEWSLYWRNRVHGEATDIQFRQVGWRFETGMEYRNYIAIYYLHHSQHVLDADGNGHFPLDNFVGCRVTFYKRDR